MEQETKKSAVEQAADALRLWSNAWREFDKTGKNKPETFEEVIKPFIEMEIEQKQRFNKFLNDEIELGISDKKTIERIQWYYNNYLLTFK